MKTDVGTPYADSDSPSTTTVSSVPVRNALAPRSANTHRATLIAALVLSAFTLYTLRAIVPAALLGAWVAGVSEPIAVRIARRFGGRTRAASLLTFALAVIVAALGTALILPIVHDVSDAIHVLRRAVLSSHPSTALPAAFDSGTGERARAPWLGVLRDVGPLASEALSAAAAAVVQLVVFVATAYYLSIDGRRLQAGLERVSPLGAENTRQFLAEFIAVGRGIVVSMGLAGFTTALALGTAYVALGVPRPLVLTSLTFIAAMAPIGAAIVWLPLALWMCTHDRIGGALVLSAVGVVVVSGFIDHLLRPWLVRFGRLSLHPLLTLLGLLGGVVAFGAWGVFLGPLLFAMTATALRVHAGRPILARRSLIPGERITRLSLAPVVIEPPAVIPPDTASMATS